MKTNFANFMEAERYLRKHLDLPKKVRIKIEYNLFTVKANGKHPDIRALRQYLDFEYHGKNAGVGVVEQYKPEVKKGEWVMSVDGNKPWIFVETENFKEITEEEFISKINGILE